jgi:PKD repeat protein
LLSRDVAVEESRRMVTRSTFPSFLGILSVVVLTSIAVAAPARRSAKAAEGAATPIPDIEITCAGTMVPAVVHVQALGKNPGAMADATLIKNRYEWDFGDVSGKWNTLTGFNAAHVYDKPGSYTITLTVTDPSGKVTTRSTKVKVGTDNRKVIFVSNEGSDSNTGMSPQSPLRTPNKALSSATNNCTVAFKAGQTFDVNDTINLKVQNLVVAAYGQDLKSPEPQRPVLRKIEGKGSSMLYVDSKAKDVLVQGILFDSIWDLKSKYGEKKVPARALTVGGVNIAVRDCTFRNVSDAINNEREPQGMLVQDSMFTDELRAQSIWGEGKDHVYVGNTMKHSRQEHLIRTSGAGVVRLLIAHNSLSRPSNAKGSIELRRSEWFWITDNHINGGTMRVGPQEQDQEREPNWEQIKCKFGVVEDNRIEKVFVNFRPGTEHVILRNNYIAYNDGEAILAECVKEGYDQVRKVKDLTIENNTAVNTGAKGKFLKVNGHAEGIALRNNLFVAPKLSTNDVQSCAVDVRDKDLSGFTAIDHNVWPGVAGPVFRVQEQPVSAQQWNGAPQVGEDKQANVQLMANGNPPKGLKAGATLPELEVGVAVQAKGEVKALKKR